MGKVVRIASGTAALVLTAASIVLWQHGRANRAIVAAQQARIAELERRPAVVPLPQDSSGSTLETGAQHARAPAANPAPVSVAKPASTHSGDWKIRILDSAYRAAFIADAKLFLRTDLEDLRQWVDMSDGTFEGFIELLANHRAQLMEVTPHTPEERKSAELERQRGQMEQRHAAEIEQFLGDTAHQQWQEWAQAVSSRMRLSTMNAQLPEDSRLGASGLREAAQAMARVEHRIQADWLASRATLPKSAADDPAARIAAIDGLLNVTRRKNEGVRAAAAPHLSAKQLEALDSVIEADYRHFETALNIQRERLKAVGRPAATAH